VRLTLLRPASLGSHTNSKELIFSGANGQNLQVLKISNPVDDTAWATSASGSLYTTDSSADTVDAITGSFTPGTAYTAVAPCNANSAPTVCPSPPAYLPNSLGTMNHLTTMCPTRGSRRAAIIWTVVDPSSPWLVAH
jgi:hypothetical protein